MRESVQKTVDSNQLVNLTICSTQTYMTFSIDEQQVGYYQFEASGGDVYAYDVLVYANDTLDMGNHTLTIQNGRPDGRQYLMFLDYITFT